MSTSATGAVVAKDDGNPLVGLKVRLEDVTQIQDGLVLDTAVIGSDGKFKLNYSAYPAINNNAPGDQPRGLRLSVLLGQLVLSKVDQKDDPNQASIAFAQIAITRKEAESNLATLGSGAVSRQSAGNGLRWLVDNEDAWAQTAAVIEKARTIVDPDGKAPFTPNPAGTAAMTLDVMQLDIDVNAFNSTLLCEVPKVVLEFEETDFRTA